MTQEGPYHVFWTPEAIGTLKVLGLLAQRMGRTDECGTLLLALEERLRRNPLDVGEVYLKRGNVVEHSAVQGYVGVSFAIDTHRKLVRVHSSSILSRRWA